MTVNTFLWNLLIWCAYNLQIWWIWPLTIVLKAFPSHFYSWSITMTLSSSSHSLAHSDWPADAYRCPWYEVREWALMASTDAGSSASTEGERMVEGRHEKLYLWLKSASFYWGKEPRVRRSNAFKTENKAWKERERKGRMDPLWLCPFSSWESTFTCFW